MTTRCLVTLFTSLHFFCACSDDTSSDSGSADASGDAAVADSGSADRTDAAAPLSCQELDLAFGEVVGSLLETYAECSGCADASGCALVEPALSCANGTRVTWCQVTVAAALSTDFLTQLESDAAPLCDRVEETCISLASCAPVSIVLTGERCELHIEY